MNTKSIRIIPSKSDAHRAFICSALSVLQSRNSSTLGTSLCRTEEDIFKGIICEESSEDIEATKSCLIEMLSSEADSVGVNLYCGESGSTLRFLLPIVGALGIRGIFHPEGRLSKRPLSPFDDELKKHGMRISEPGSIPLISEGKLLPGKFNIPGNISSQFVSGLLFALPILDGDSEIIVEGELESAPYVDMTIKTLKAFGITIKEMGENPSKRFIVEGNQAYIHPEKYIVEGDWSNAAFWLAMGALGSEAIRVDGLRNGSMQADERILDALDVFGVYFEMGSSRSRIEGTESGFHVDVYPSKDRMQGIIWDASETPDIVPVIALLAAFAKGETRIVNAARLRLKESDRLNTVAETLRSLGAEVEELDDGLIIRGRGGLATSKDASQGTSEDASQEISDDAPHCTLDSYGDHRIAMMAAAASVALDPDTSVPCAESVALDEAGQDACRIKLSGWQAVNKSYPTFFDRLSELGLDGNLELI